jgi:hypothetical protein
MTDEDGNAGENTAAERETGGETNPALFEQKLAGDAELKRLADEARKRLWEPIVRRARQMRRRP